MTQTAVEQRRETRTNLSWPVSVWVPQANRFYNGKSANISKAGVLINVPIDTPLDPGSVVELNFPRTTNLAKKKGQFARIKQGRVIRIDKEDGLDGALMGVGIAFEQ
jgi:hypothetical protein